MPWASLVVAFFFFLPLLLVLWVGVALLLDCTRDRRRGVSARLLACRRPTVAEEAHEWLNRQ